TFGICSLNHSSFCSLVSIFTSHTQKFERQKGHLVFSRTSSEAARRMRERHATHQYARHLQRPQSVLQQFFLMITSGFI
ncbi:hypothetical protein PMAYCL1PPCAC_00752, partial [Pristionchus mayeri]